MLMLAVIDHMLALGLANTVTTLSMATEARIKYDNHRTVDVNETNILLVHRKPYYMDVY